MACAQVAWAQIAEKRGVNLSGVNGCGELLPFASKEECKGRDGAAQATTATIKRVMARYATPGMAAKLMCLHPLTAVALPDGRVARACYPPADGTRLHHRLDVEAVVQDNCAESALRSVYFPDEENCVDYRRNDAAIILASNSGEIDACFR